MFGPTGMVVPMMLPPATSSSNSAPPKVPASEKSSTGGSAASYASSQAEVKSQEDDSRQTSSELTVSEGDGKSPFVDKMMTQTNLLVLPPSNPSYQMAYFLKTTGPVKEPTVKSARSKRISSAMRMFKNSSSSRYPTKSLASAHMRLNEVIFEEKAESDLDAKAAQDKPAISQEELATSESKLLDIVVPKVSKNGKRYYEIEPKEGKPGAAPESHNINESNVSVFVTSTESLHDWVLDYEEPNPDSNFQTHEGPEALRGWPIKRISQTLPHEETIRVLSRHSPVRPLFLGTRARTDNSAADRHLRVIHGRTAPLRSHPVLPGPVPDIAPPALPEKKVGPAVADPTKAAQVAQPNPRRLHGHPPVLNRTSSDVTGLRFSHLYRDGRRSTSDSPGPPPPRSPLRVSIPAESLDEMLDRSKTPASPDTREKEVTPINEEQAIRVTKEAAITYVSRESRDDDLPFALRPGSSGTSSDVFCANATPTKAGSSKPLDLLDAMVRASQQNTSRRRLRRARPEGPRALDLGDSRSQDSLERDQRQYGYCTSPLSVKHTSSIPDMSENYRVIATTASPSPRVSHIRKVPNARGRSSPAPRVKRGRGAKSATSTPSRAGSPSKKSRQSSTPELLSPPPKKGLPPTPHERSDRVSRPEAIMDIGVARSSSSKELPLPPGDNSGYSMMFPSPPSSAKTGRYKLQAGENSPTNIEARMDALERRNKLLEAALSAVLKTGGMLNGCPCQASHPHEHECQEAGSSSLVTHDSVRSRVSSTSNESSALDVYLNTRGR